MSGTNPAMPPPATGAAADDKPRDARLIELLLTSAGIQDCDEQVVPMLLEFAHRYVSDVLSEAMLFAEHAHRADLSVDDVKLAVQSKVNHAFTAPPPKDFLLELSREKNAMPLPLIPERPGIRLPPKQYTLTAVNYTILPKPGRLEGEIAAPAPAPAAEPARPAPGVAHASAANTPAGSRATSPTLSARSAPPVPATDARQPDTTSAAGAPPSATSSALGAPPAPVTGNGGDETDEEMDVDAPRT
ncbi:Transcription initiation factor TFIID subunit 9 [Blastocladiella emersonii ATCC 22665]|nr:Transcription initiation factor TFIID subunit 9 [Blastocladiella emersonii ATCC 22665]